MTAKQENILKAALELFAEHGYNGTSTSKIARKAGVSEGLIFRHFGNKKGLLDALIKLGVQKSLLFLHPIFQEDVPTEVIRRIIELPFSIPVEEYDFWRLQFKIEWEVGYMVEDQIVDEQLQQTLENAFTQLGYKQAKLEANYLLLVIEAISSSILRGALKEPLVMRDFLRSKYFP